MSSYRAPSDVLLFWFGEGPDHGKRHKRWFEKDAAFDADIRVRFLPLCEELVGGARRDWLERPAGCLARIVALDQFPRNMFRGSARAYDRAMLPVERMFAYLPFEHSESLEDQLLACELTLPLAVFAETADAHRYAVAHRDIIRRFARFPHRNAALGRASTAAEIEFLNQPGSGF